MSKLSTIHDLMAHRRERGGDPELIEPRAG